MCQDERALVVKTIQKRPLTTSQNSTLEEKTATKRAPAIELPTIQEIGTKTTSTIQKRAPKIATHHYWPLKDNHHQPKIKIKKKKKKIHTRSHSTKKYLLEPRSKPQVTMNIIFNLTLAKAKSSSYWKPKYVVRPMVVRENRREGCGSVAMV